MALLTTGLETHPDGTVNPNALINGNWQRLDEILTAYRVDVKSMYGVPAENRVFRLKMPYGGLLEKIYVATDTGTCNFTTSIDGVAVGGGSGTATTAGFKATTTGNNLFAFDSNIDITVNTVSTATHININLKIVKDLPV